MTGAIVIQVRFGLQPLRRLAIDLAAICAGRRQRLGGGYPREVALLAEAMNAVLGRIHADRALVAPRGARLDEAVPGWGLGLGIVADLAAINGGSFAIDRSELGGVRARLDFPA